MMGKRKIAPSLTLPSKKVTYLAIACFAAAGAIGFAVKYSPKDQEVGPSVAALTVVSEPMTDSSLSTSEEFKKWQETLTAIEPSSKKSTTTPVKLTATERLAQDLFSTYAGIKQSGGEITPEMQEQIARNLVTKSQLTSDYGFIDAKVYSIDDIVVTNTNSNVAFKNYGTAVGTILERDAKLPQGLNELIIFELAVNSQNENDLAKLDIIISSYQKILKGLLSTPVPQNMVVMHLGLINNFSRIITIDLEMRKFFDDPLTSMNAFNNYEDTSIAIWESFKSIQNFFSSKGIEYQQGEPGYTLIHV